MFKFIYEFLFPSETEKLRVLIEKKYKEAITFQRNGNIREYSRIMTEIESLEEQLINCDK